jgi:hypothetical protein
MVRSLRISLLISALLLVSLHGLAQKKEASLADIIADEVFKFVDSLSRYDYNQFIYHLDASGTTAEVIISSKTTSFKRLSTLFDLPTEDIRYVFPQPDSIKVNKKEGYAKYYMPPGGFTVIRKRDLTDGLEIIGDTITYRTPKKTTASGNFGHHISPGNFNQLSYAWFIPKEFEIISYSCNRQGKWQVKGNMIHFVAKPKQNNFVFEIKYRRIRNVPKEFKGRSVNYVKTLNVGSNNITIKANDHQTEDGDIISLNLNGEWVLRGFEVQKQPISLHLSLKNGDNFLIMYAENLGSIPPNTAAIEVVDGKSSQRVVLNSDIGQCEAILLRR